MGGRTLLYQSLGAIVLWIVGLVVAGRNRQWLWLVVIIFFTPWPRCCMACSGLAIGRCRKGAGRGSFGCGRRGVSSPPHCAQALSPGYVPSPSATQ